MNCRTTIHLECAVHRRLNVAAKKKGVDIEEMILALMRVFAKRQKKEVVGGRTVQYQERRSDVSWECVHVRWYSDEYEFLIDLRKVHKKSVSRLIAEAIQFLLDELWSHIDILLDKNQDHRYGMAKFDYHNIIGCIFLWDVS